MELAFILPVFLLITFGIIDWGWVFFVRQAMVHAARESVRAMAVQEKSAAEGQAIAEQILGDALPPYNFSIAVQNNVDPEISVEIRIPVSDVELSGFLGLASTDMVATVVMQREGL